MTIRESAEDYLEAMLMLREQKGYIRSVDVADKLGVTKPSVSYAVKRLRENDYLLMNQDGHITLTEKGETIAQRIYERHRILTKILLKIGVSEESAKADACRIEHDICDETFEAIRRFVDSEN
ncbi:MAG: metal-dependent transcriptional regulator [Solobacterium sp.]|nr:metal-dependent transcriptional regulator [Clostridia bacterium]MBR3345479.1 metal-dependent transcriptional regulator [Solobacterium sp.]